MFKKACLIAHYGEDYIAYRVNFLNYLTSLGVEQCFGIVPKDKHAEEVAKTPYPVYFYEYNRSWKFFADIFKTYKQFKQIIAAEKPDLVFTYKFFPNLLGVYVAKKLKVKTVVATVAGLGFLDKQGSSLLINKVFKAYLSILKKADFIVVQNSDDQILLQKFIEPSKIILTNGSGVNKEKFIQITAPDREKWGMAVDNKYFLFCSRIVKEKGILELVEAFKNLKDKFPNAVLLIAGWFDSKGIEKEVLSKIESIPSIKYIGYQKNVKEIVQLSDCVVLPSYYPEGVPRSLTESLALSKPIITTNHKGCKETCIDTVNGYLVEPGNVTDLQQKMEFFLTLTPGQVKNMQESSLNLFNDKFEQGQIFKTIADKILYA
ncbi:glycosyltransferase involved in cell wall biosynthesis [Mucilaginibacter sp. UYP25]|uniref:glycosyltransferase n=1 Tax=unclassified Mucilaginibacter TaxID=2617802 RepID=UPI00339155EB